MGASVVQQSAFQRLPKDENGQRSQRVARLQWRRLWHSLGYFRPSKTGASIVNVLCGGLQYGIVIVAIFPSSLGIRVCVTIIVQVLDARA
jgi:hypothetical protein